MNIRYIPVGVVLLIMMVVGYSDQYSQLDAMLNNDSLDPSDGVVYRWYKSGDTLMGVDLSNCLAPGIYCYVAVDNTGQKEVTIGVVKHKIPYQGMPNNIEKLIRKKMKKKNGVLGYITYVYVREDRRGQGIAKTLLEESFHLISVTIPSFGAMSLVVRYNNAAAIALYKKVGYELIINITKTGYSYYARYP
ncbi:hypothetical protein Pmar_PMAR008409 [Perkinsus marinus ATCC 50983]|uniref:N-acetyltransferase domain-containing protein n=1 Tax=Perkinsus marinus (strain ATCC 50983 / TXsc) TaxID=423536 RepID=C5LXK4_PERM5|nr:hypothetical protein Pmar_PMAR008409 [Perkinsus marinus ATCC 50983]EEQ98526.1 hypothetical protein Pmar_PMAR008409 [Perkinsus marinus ATCC 50983]|eukprot:XP_002765809.1 hypothetical protein Pmar_PMAR008409 [Perkinsus marinus ATCC 50983]